MTFAQHDHVVQTFAFMLGAAGALSAGLVESSRHLCGDRSI